MDQEIKDLLKQQLELLKKINKHFVYQRILGIVKTVIVVGLIVFSAIQLQPYLDSILGAFSQIQGIQQGINLPELLNQNGL